MTLKLILENFQEEIPKNLTKICFKNIEFIVEEIIRKEGQVELNLSIYQYNSWNEIKFIMDGIGKNVDVKKGGKMTKLKQIENILETAINDHCIKVDSMSLTVPKNRASEIEKVKHDLILHVADKAKDFISINTSITDNGDYTISAELQLFNKSLSIIGLAQKIANIKEELCPGYNQ